MNKNHYCVVYQNEITLFTNWLETKNFAEGKPGRKMKGFATKEEAQAWGESLLIEEGAVGVRPPPFKETSLNTAEAGRIFKLIANEYRDFTRDGNTMRIKKICLCFDKLSDIFK